ncbi:MAG: ACT domain-containing protein [Archaeoglobi archaeon]|nr:ACT domain-containing protein [Archaeoglobi archaeon]
MIEVHEEVFAVVNVESLGNADFFAAVRDADGKLTLILPEKHLKDLEFSEVEKGFRLITFRTKLPFDTVGFIAKVSSALAQEGIPILVLSSFSTDHILVRNEHVERAVEILEKVV